MRPRLTALLLALAGLMIGCSGDTGSDANPEATPSSDETEVALPTPAEGALPDVGEYTEARQTLADSGGASYVATTSDGSGTVIARQRGFVSTGGSVFGSYFFQEFGEADQHRSGISVEDEAWLTNEVVDNTLSGCWVHRALGKNDLSFEILPPVLRVMFDASSPFEDPAAAPEIDPDVAITVFPEDVQARVGPIGDVAGGAPIGYQTRDGRLTVLTVALDDVLAAAEAAGAKPDPGLAKLQLKVAVSLELLDHPIETAPPNPDRQVEIGETETVSHALARCDAG